MDNQELQNDYKKLYEAEREKSEVLVSKIEECEKEIEELNFKLDRIKGSFAWKLATPLRKGLHFYEKTRDRLTRYGSIPGLMRKVRSKMQERKNMKRHGTASFPSPEEAKRQREEVFPNMVKFSILENIITFLPVSTVYHILLPIGVVMGIGIGFLGSFFTVRKHLKV